MLATVHHPAVAELEDDAAVNIQVVAVSLRAVVMNADHVAVIIGSQVPQLRPEGPSRLPSQLAEVGERRLTAFVVTGAAFAAPAPTAGAPACASAGTADRLSAQQRHRIERSERQQIHAQLAQPIAQIHAVHGVEVVQRAAIGAETWGIRQQRLHSSASADEGAHVAKPSLQDLIRDGRLPVGTELYHKGARYTAPGDARIHADGIEVSGTVYASPSGAARAVIGNTAVNGWRWWRITADGHLLSDVRARGSTEPEH